MENGNGANSANGWKGRVHVTDHPLVRTKLSIIRDRKTDAKVFRELVYEIGLYVGFQATSHLATTAEKNVSVDCWGWRRRDRRMASLAPLRSTSFPKRSPLYPLCEAGMGSLIVSVILPPWTLIAGHCSNARTDPHGSRTAHWHFP